MKTVVERDNGDGDWEKLGVTMPCKLVRANGPEMDTDSAWVMTLS